MESDLVCGHYTHRSAEFYGKISAHTFYSFYLVDLCFLYFVAREYTHTGLHRVVEL